MLMLSLQRIKESNLYLQSQSLSCEPLHQSPKIGGLAFLPPLRKSQNLLPKNNMNLLYKYSHFVCIYQTFAATFLLEREFNEQTTHFAPRKYHCFVFPVLDMIIDGLRCNAQSFSHFANRKPFKFIVLHRLQTFLDSELPLELQSLPATPRRRCASDR